MSGSVNKATIIGNLGKDPDVRSLGDGSKVANLTIATSERWKDKNSGEQKEKTEWHNVAVFGKLAETAEKYISKGSKVYIEGKIQTRKWQDKDGNDRYTTEIVLQGFDSKLVMLDSRDFSTQGSPTGWHSSQPAQGNTNLDDEIPF